MSHPQPPIREPTSKETDQYKKTLHAAAIGTLIVAPVLALLPPRKLDFYTISLCGMGAYSGNYLWRERTGKSIWQRAVENQGDSSLPTERAREYNRQYKLQQEEQMRKDGKQAQQGVLEKVWMGAETEGWKERREKEVQEKLKEGKGYGDIITDQIWDVWTWGKSGGKNEEEKK